MTPAAAQQEPHAAERTEKGDLTRRHILDAAATAFARNGYAGTSLNDVIKDAGLTKGGFYFHFPSKEALALAVVQDRQEIWLRDVSTAAFRHTRAVDQLLAVADALCDLYDRDPAFGSMAKLCRELGIAGTHGTPGSEISRQVFTTWFRLTAMLIERGQAEGDLRQDVDPMAAAEAAVAAFLGIKDMSDLMTGGADLRRRMQDFSALFLAALRMPESPAPASRKAGA